MTKAIIFLIFGIALLILGFAFEISSLGAMLFQLPAVIIIGWNAGAIQGKLKNKKGGI